jgi:hypothetical protein
MTDQVSGVFPRPSKDDLQARPSQRPTIPAPDFDPREAWREAAQRNAQARGIWFDGRLWTLAEFDAETAREDEQEFNSIMRAR